MDYELFNEEFKDWARKYKFQIDEDIEFTSDSGPVEEWLSQVLFNEHEPVKGLIALGQFDEWKLHSVESEDNWQTAQLTFKHKTKGEDQFTINDLENSDWLSSGTLDLLLKTSKRFSKYRLRAFTNDNFFTIAALKKNAYEDLEDIIYVEPEEAEYQSDYSYEEEVESLSFPYEIYKVKSRNALSKLKELKKEGRGYPIILGSDYDLQHMQLNLSKYNLDRGLSLYSAAYNGNEEAEENLKKEFSAIIDAEHFINQEREVDIGKLEFDGLSIEEMLASAKNFRSEGTTIDDWLEENISTVIKPQKRRTKRDEDGEDVQVKFDDDGLPSLDEDALFVSCINYGSVYIVNLPTSEPWEIPCLLNIRGFDPEPEFPYQYETNIAPDYLMLSAVLKYWHEQYDIQVVGVSSDSMEIVIKNPPKNKKQAEELALEQYHLCPNILNSEIKSIGDLADILLKERFWFFSWDWLLSRRSFLWKQF